ncbi:MAG: glycosyltransferase family 4 protein [Candidatus Aenigmarchaeota archaeon]|nr:glycosyltransferase family 4 protein [Candidatus Aenigmarchaeota archaeon]
MSDEKRLKIAFVYPFPLAIGKNIPKFPGNFGVGGGETYSFRAAMKMAERGHKVTFFTGRFPGIKKNTLVMGNLRIEYLPVKIWKSIAYYAVMPSLVPKLLFGGFDVIHSWQFPTAYTFLSGIVAKATNKKFVVSHVGLTPGISRATKMFSKMNTGIVDRVILMTDFGRKYFKGYVRDRKIDVIYPGIDTEFFAPTRDRSLERKYAGKKVVLYAGRLIPSKGIDYLVRAFAKVTQRHRKSVLILIGQGHMEKRLRELVAELKISDKVVFTGYVPDDKMSAYYTLADVFVLPPVYKDSLGGYAPEPGGFGLVLAEAMACDTPTIATRVDTIPYWIKDGHNGLLCDPNDSKCLEKKINLLIESKAVRDRIVRNAKEIVYEKYSLEKVADQMEEVYGKIRPRGRV